MLGKQKKQVEQVKNGLTDDLRKGSFRNEKCPECGTKMKKCKCGFANPKDKVKKYREEYKEEIDQYKQEEMERRLDEFDQFLDNFGDKEDD